jgi:hypothetical protein
MWSLGATLYAAVEGHPPYERDTVMATLGALLTQEPDPPKHAGPLRPVLESLLRKQPAKRSSVRRTRALLARVLDEDRDQLSWLDQRGHKPLIAGVAILTAGVAALAIAIWTHGDSPPVDSGAAPSTTGASVTVQSSANIPLESIRHALVIRCTAARCGVFVSDSPDNDVLFNGVLRQGQAREFDEARMNLVVSDSSTLDVYIYGKLQTKGPPGKRRIYTIVKG